MKNWNFKEVFILGSPLLAGMFSEYLMSISDAIMMGRFGTEFLAAIAIGTLVVEILWAFAWTLAPAVQTLVSRRYGARDTLPIKFTGQVLNAGILLSFIIGIIVVAVSFIAGPVLQILIKDKPTFDFALLYISIIRWSIPISGFYYAIYGFLSGIKKTNHVMYATVGMNALNVLLNYIFIFGKLGLPEMGIKGAAWGTLIASITGLIYFFVLILLSPAFKKYNLFSFKNIPLKLYLDIAKTWFPLSIQHVFAFSIFLVYESIISRFGTLQLAVIHITLSIYWMSKTIVGGYAEGAAILVGNAFGKGNKKEALNSAYAGIIIGIGFSAAIYFMAMFHPSLLVRIFNSETKTVEAGTKALKFFAIFILIGSIGQSIEIIFSHNGWSKFVLTADILCNFVFTLGFTMLAYNIFHTPLIVIWSGYVIYIVVYTAILFVGFYSMKWTKINADSSISEIKR